MLMATALSPTIAAQGAASPQEPAASASATVPDEQRAFSTRHARFLPAAWHDLPGWQDDDLSEAWRAFLQSCVALGRRPGWEAPCLRAREAGRGNGPLRAFFEREFVLYEIRNADSTPDGVITGYYEPLLAGSRTRQGAYVHPVYGEPADMLTLDASLWPKALRGQTLPARLEGRRVIPVPGSSAPYLIDVGDLAPDDRDKKLRLRLDGQRVVPYFTRAEIERNGALRAPVLAWVDNPAALYSMQIQGSGKLRLPDGRMLRLAFAEQNGHPFRPPVAAASAAARKARITTRGLSIELPEGEDDPLPLASDTVGEAEPLSRGGRRSAPAAAVSDGEVERMIALLAGGRGPTARPSDTAAPTPPAAPAPPPAARRDAAPEARPARAAVPAAERTPIAQPSAQMLAAISADPSYVFFREIPDGPGGPIGALGVPLTAGRSVAVDPRTTPLGFPVFLATSHPGDKEHFNRLVMAQDTGGAIRGAVRADYFWGFGADAYAQAARMKESGRMWLLMPTGQQIAARDQAVPTRGGAADPAAMSDCVVADPELCVEDR